MGCTKAVETDCKKQELFRLRGAGQRASFRSLPGPCSRCLPTPMLSSAWPSLGDLYSPSSTLAQAPSPAPALSPGEEVVVLRLGAGPASSRGPREGSWARPGRPQPPAAGAGESVGRGRGRVKARRSPPPEGVTAYKKGAALGTGAAGSGGAARLRRAQAVPASGASHASHRSHRPGPRGRMSESKRRGRGRDPKHREGRKRERKQELLPGEEGRALPRRAQTPCFPGRNLPPAHPPPAPRG